MTEENNAPEEHLESGMSEAAQSALEALSGLSGAQELQKRLSELGGETNKNEVVEPIKEETIKDPESIEQIAAETLNSKENKEDNIEEQPLDESNKEEPNEDDLFIESPIYGGKQGVNKKKDAESEDFTADLKDTEALSKVISEKTGYNNLNELIESSLKFKEVETQVQEVSKENENYKKVFESIPSELYQSIDLFLKGQDWKTPIISKPNLDFSKNIDTIDEKSLVDNYLPGQFSQEEWEDYGSEDADPGIKKAINLAINTAKSKFEADKKDLDSFRTNQVELANERSQKINSSVEKSIEYLKKNIEGIDDGYIAQAKANLNIQKINEMLFNEDGTFKEDAALKLSYAEHGHDIMKQYKNAIQHLAETKERQAILERTPNKPKQNKKSSSTREEARPEVLRVIDDLTKDLGQSKVY